MWVAYDGVAHTVALTNPTGAMQDDFTASITSLVEDDRSLSLRILELQDEIFALIESRDEAIPNVPGDEGLPDDYLHGCLEAVSDVSDYLGKIELSRRIDALTAALRLGRW